MSDDEVAFLRKALERLYSAVTKVQTTGVDGLHEALAYAALALDVKAEPKPADWSDGLLCLGGHLLGWALLENETTVLRLDYEMNSDANLHIFVTLDNVIAAVLDGQMDPTKWGDA